MSVEFTIGCPDCGRTLVAVAHSGNPYDWDIEDCLCEQQRLRVRA